MTGQSQKDSVIQMIHSLSDTSLSHRQIMERRGLISMYRRSHPEHEEELKAIIFPPKPVDSSRIDCSLQQSDFIDCIHYKIVTHHGHSITQHDLDSLQSLANNKDWRTIKMCTYYFSDIQKIEALDFGEIVHPLVDILYFSWRLNPDIQLWMAYHMIQEDFPAQDFDHFYLRYMLDNEFPLFEQLLEAYSSHPQEDIARRAQFHLQAFKKNYINDK